MRHQYKAKFALVFSTLLIAFVAASYGAFLANSINRNEDQLLHYTQSILSRAERAIDLTIMKLSEQNLSFAGECTSELQDKLQRAVYTGGLIKNIQLTANGSCSAFGGAFGTTGSLFKQPSFNENYSLYLVETGLWRGLGVTWTQFDDSVLTAIISTENILYDILPSAIREQGRLELRLNDGSLISRYDPNEGADISSETSSRFEVSSRRYPLSASLEIPDAAIWNWNTGVPFYLGAILLIVDIAICFFLTRGLVRDRGFAGELEQAIKHGEIIPFYQPIYDLQSETVSGMELLARWKKSDGEMIPPDKFIPFAEDNGKIDDITTSVLATAGRDFGALLRCSPNLKLTVNITPEQFLRDGFVDWFLSLLTESRLPPTNIVVEVTERQSIYDSTRAAEVSSTLLDAGIRVALDDAGTGHNGISSIHSLGAQIIKIDKYFVDALLVDSKAETLVEIFVTIAHKFGMTVVAEGIETRDQAGKLATMGVAEGQGFLFSRPLPTHQLRRLLEEEHAKAELNENSTARSKLKMAI